MVEAQVCPGLMVKSEERWPMAMEQSPSNNCRGLGLNKASILGKNLDGKAPWVK
jgi:hypothetical protein